MLIILCLYIRTASSKDLLPYGACAMYGPHVVCTLVDQSIAWRARARFNINQIVSCSLLSSIQSSYLKLAGNVWTLYLNGYQRRVVCPSASRAPRIGPLVELDKKSLNSGYSPVKLGASEILIGFR